MEITNKLIWPGKESNKISEYSNADWIKIVQYLLSSLEEYLKGPIIIEEKIEDNVGNGFCINFKFEMPGAIVFSCKGILGGSVIEGSNEIYISVNLFLYSNKKKIITKDNDSFVYLEYKKDGYGNGYWENLGWEFDEYGEYEYFDNY